MSGVARQDVWRRAAYAILVAVTAATIAWTWMAGSAASLGARTTAAGGPMLRDVDVEQIMRLIQEGRLSDREAQFYRPFVP